MQLRRLHQDERAELPSAMLAEWERRGFVMRGWNRSHVLTAKGEAVIGIGGARSD